MADGTYQAKNYHKQGGDEWVIGAGGTLTVEGAITQNGVSIKTARGQLTTVTAADTVVTGLASVAVVVCSLDSDPTDNPEWATATIGDQAGSPAAGSVIIKTWQNTSGSDPTPTAATIFAKKVNWIAIGS